MLKRVFPFFTLGWSSTPSEPKPWSKGGYLYTPVPNVQTGNLPDPEYQDTLAGLDGVNSYDLIKEPNPSKTLNYELYGGISPNPNNSPIFQFPSENLNYKETSSKLCFLGCSDYSKDRAYISLVLRTSDLSVQKEGLILLANIMYKENRNEPFFPPDYSVIFGERTPKQLEEFLNTYGVAPLGQKATYVANQVPPDSRLASIVVNSRNNYFPVEYSYQSAYIFSFDIWSLEGMDNPNKTSLSALCDQYPNQSIRLSPNHISLMGNDIVYESYESSISKDNEVYTKCFANPEVKSARNIGVFVQSRESFF
ncbi:MAG: hypothetical protein SOR95_08490 [Sutterella sp.]|nr:hypothetical protein [Sutterella sp.]